MKALGATQCLAEADPVEAVARFVAGFTHRLQSPLTGLRGYGELAEREEDRAMRAYWHQQLQSGIDSLDLLLEGFRRYQLPERIELRDYSAHKLAAEAWSIALKVTPGAKCKHVKLENTLPEDLILRVDPFHFRNLMVNLMQNALDASEPEGVVCVGVEPDAILRIEDRGTGLGQLSDAQMLEPFFTTRTDRAGLGLAVANQIAIQHGFRLAWRDGSHGGTCALLLPENEEHHQQRSQR